MQEAWVWFLGQEDSLEKEMVIHSSILAWSIPWTEEHRGLQSMGLQRVRHSWVTKQQHIMCIHLSGNLLFISYRNKNIKKNNKIRVKEKMREKIIMPQSLCNNHRGMSIVCVRYNCMCFLVANEKRYIYKMSNDSYYAYKIKIYLLSRRCRTCIVSRSKENFSGVSAEEVSFIWLINMLHDIPATQIRRTS